MRLISSIAASALLVTSAYAVDLATVTNSFGIRLFTQMTPTDTCVNAVMSPYSVESAMAALSVGASGETRAEIVHALVLPSNPDETVMVFKNLRAAAQRAASGSDWTDSSALFIQRGLQLKSATEAEFKLGFDAQIRPLDLVGDPAGSATSIATWISGATHGRISGLTPRLDPRTEMVLVDAVYLKATWLEPFQPADTTARTFFGPGSAELRVPTMSQVNYLGYGRLPGCQALALPYEGGDLQLVILLPDEKYGAADVARSLKPAELTWLKSLSHHGRDVHVFLPKFRTSPASVDLSGPLGPLGVRRIFDPQRAEWDGLLPPPHAPVAVTHFLHRAYVEVDEQGTIAAAGDTVLMAPLGIRAEPANPIEFRVDHPFLFVIQDTKSGVCLFLGSVADPSAP